MVFFLLFILAIFAPDAEKPKLSLMDIYKQEIKKEMVPTWKRLMRFPYKTCSNWEEIQRGQTDFVNQKRTCISKCYSDDMCTGVMVIIGQERGCRYLSGTCMTKESYDWEYFHKFVPFSSTPYMLGMDDRSIRFEFSQLSMNQVRCWLYLVSDDEKAKNKNIKNAEESPIAYWTLPQDALMGFIVNAYAITPLMTVKNGQFYFDNLMPETYYQAHCANGAGSKTEPVTIKTSAWPLDWIRSPKAGCIEGEAESKFLGSFTRVGLQFCREMCIRRKCFSFMYGRPDGVKGGTCFLTMSCGRRIAASMDEFNLYSPINLDFDVIRSNAKCTPNSPGGTGMIPNQKMLGQQLINPLSCRKMCYSNPACEFFLFGKQGAQKGTCFQMNSDCRTFEPDPNFDVWKLTRLNFHLHKMNAECLSANSMYIHDELTFDHCREACDKKVNCNYFTRLDIDNQDRGVCLGAMSCEKSRYAEGYFVFQIMIPPPLQIEDIDREGKDKVDRMGNKVEDDGADQKAGGSGGDDAKKERRLLEMTSAAGLGQEFEPRLKIPILPKRSTIREDINDKGYWNAMRDLLYHLSLTEQFLFFVWPLVCGGFVGLLAERFWMSS